jgi:phosphopantothenoylcysteine decarboxylase/phosphopantothenate--cysteine ligase
MAAAVADFRPAQPAARKLKKDAGPPPAIELESTGDILSALAHRRRPEQVMVGFAAEHGEESIGLGREKLERKRLDAIVVNDISRSDIGFEVDANEVVIITAGGTRRVERTSKERIARAILDETDRLLSAKEGTDGAVRAADARSIAGV